MAFLFFTGMTPGLIIHKKHLSVQDPPPVTKFVGQMPEYGFPPLS
jgi:hypothetical protein